MRDSVILRAFVHPADGVRFRQDRIIQRSDKVVYVRQEAGRDAFLVRNRKLVDESGYCISYCNRLTGGTAYTVRYAMKQGLRVMNASSWDLRQLGAPAGSGAPRR